MYSDAYSSAIPLDRLEQLADAAAPCWIGHDAQEAWRCALRAADASFCPRLAAAAGGIGGERERAILDALADELRHHARHRARSITAPSEQAASAASAP